MADVLDDLLYRLYPCRSGPNDTNTLITQVYRLIAWPPRRMKRFTLEIMHTVYVRHSMRIQNPHRRNNKPRSVLLAMFITQQPRISVLLEMRSGYPSVELHILL